MTLEQMTNLKRLHFVTTDSLTFKFNDGKFEVGFFTPQEESINVENKWRIVTNNDSVKYRETQSNDYTKIIDGNKVIDVL